jgi:hypothetical protein
MASVINALLDDDGDDEHCISRVYSSTASRLDLGESARCCDSTSLQPLRQHNLDCVGQPLPGSRAGSISPHWTIAWRTHYFKKKRKKKEHILNIVKSR